MSKWLTYRKFEGGVLPYKIYAKCADGSYPFDLMGGGISWQEAEEGLIRNIREIAHKSKLLEVENE